MFVNGSDAVRANLTGSSVETIPNALCSLHRPCVCPIAWHSKEPAVGKNLTITVSQQVYLCLQGQAEAFTVWEELELIGMLFLFLSQGFFFQAAASSAAR